MWGRRGEKGGEGRRRGEKGGKEREKKGRSEGEKKVGRRRN